ncbi:uncharacterized protein VP01_11451g1, partial [Puccinia sorghi]
KSGVFRLVDEGLCSSLNSAIQIFYQSCQHRAEVALQNLRQTGTVSDYTQEFNQHTRTFGWANTPLMSLYQHCLRENIHLAVVMRKTEFDSL